MVQSSGQIFQIPLIMIKNSFNNEGLEIKVQKIIKLWCFKDEEQILLFGKEAQHFIHEVLTNCILCGVIHIQSLQD